LNLFAIDWNSSGVIFDLDEKRKRLKEIEEIISKEGFWDIPEDTRDILRERTAISDTIDSWQKITHELDDAGILLGLAVEEDLASGHLVGRMSRDDLGEGALPGAVGAHEGVDLAAADREVDAAEDLHLLSLEGDVEVAYLEQMVRHLQLSCLTGGRAS